MFCWIRDVVCSTSLLYVVHRCVFLTIYSCSFFPITPPGSLWSQHTLATISSKYQCSKARDLLQPLHLASGAKCLKKKSKKNNSFLYDIFTTQSFKGQMFLSAEVATTYHQPPTIAVSLGPRVCLQEKLKSSTISCQYEEPSLTAIARRAGVWGSDFLLGDLSPATYRSIRCSFLWSSCYLTRRETVCHTRQASGLIWYNGYK